MIKMAFYFLVPLLQTHNPSLIMRKNISKSQYRSIHYRLILTSLLQNCPGRLPWWLSGKESACHAKIAQVINKTRLRNCYNQETWILKKLWCTNRISMWLSGKESTCQLRRYRRRRFNLRQGRSPGGGNGSPLQYSCWEKSHRHRSRAGYSLWGRKQSDTTEHALNKKLSNYKL